MSQQEIHDKIVARAWQDESFKQELLRNPKAALAKEGINIPQGVEVTVFEETPTALALVLPINSAPQELAESELESVAGGTASAQGINIDIGWD